MLHLALEPAGWLARSADQAGGLNDRHRLDFKEEIRVRQRSHFDSCAGHFDNVVAFYDAEMGIIRRLESDD
jgi:hypothetical protein